MAVRTPPKIARRQRGVVLFIALIAMVVLSLAGVALIRSVDTTGSVAGNIAFREACAGGRQFVAGKGGRRAFHLENRQH